MLPFLKFDACGLKLLVDFERREKTLQTFFDVGGDALRRNVPVFHQGSERGDSFLSWPANHKVALILFHQSIRQLPQAFFE
jgi:hypothetical protein